MVPGATRRECLLDLVVEEDGPHPVATAREQPGERRRELAQDELLRPADRAEPHRRRPVEKEPCGELAILGVLPDERRIHPCRHVPVDVADVVTGLVLAEVEEVRAEAAERGAVAPLEQAVEPADHLPLEPMKEPFGRQPAKGRGGFHERSESDSAAGNALPQREFGNRDSREDAVDDVVGGDAVR